MKAHQRKPYPSEQQREAVARVLAFRVRTYERRVTEGSMSRRQAEEGISLMRAILADYEAQVANERTS